MHLGFYCYCCCCCCYLFSMIKLWIIKLLLLVYGVNARLSNASLLLSNRFQFFFFFNVTRCYFSFRLPRFGLITSCSEHLCQFRFPTLYCKICSLPLWSNSSKLFIYFWQSTKLNRKISMRSSLLVIISFKIVWCRFFEHRWIDSI